MARTTDEKAHNAKRDEILDAALSLVYSKGYAQMAIQDILDRLKISKGAFYHYFNSKQALMEALVERMGQQAEQVLLPIVQDPGLSAIQKFRGYFEAGAQWKSAQQTLIINLLRVWFSDENAFLRQKMTEGSRQHTPLLLEPIIRQGIEEKVFTTRFPEQAAMIVAGVTMSLSDTIIRLLLSPEADQATGQALETLLDATVDSIERILGAPPGSLDVFEPGMFDEWLPSVQPEPLIEKE